MVDEEILMDIGIPKNEAEIYLILLKVGEATSYSVSSISSIPRSSIYDILNKLVEKGLVSYITKNNKKYFRALEPEKILNILKIKEEIFSKNLTKLNEIYQSKLITPQVEVFEGINGLKMIMQDTIDQNEDIFIFSGVDISKMYENVPKYYLNRLLKEKKRKNIKTYLLYPKNITPIKGYNYYLKKMPLNFGNISYWVYKDRTVITMWKMPVLCIRIISEEIAKIYKASIKMMWDSIK